MKKRLKVTLYITVSKDTKLGSLIDHLGKMKDASKSPNVKVRFGRLRISAKKTKKKVK